MSIKFFEKGSLVWVNLGKRDPRVAGIVLDSSDISTREHGYELFKVELHKTVRGLSGEPVTSKWTHPKPVQGYKLTKRVE